MNSFQSEETETSVQLSPASKLTVSLSLVHLHVLGTVHSVILNKYANVLNIVVFKYKMSVKQCFFAVFL